MENCACIKDKGFYFTIDYKDDYLVYTDYSDWIMHKSKSLITEYDLEITNGKSKKTFTVPVNKSTIIKYSDLPITCDLPCNFDGVYTFTITACQDTQVFERTEAILESVIRIYDKLICDERWDDAFDIFKWMESIKSHVRVGNIDQASKSYITLMTLIKKLKCDCYGFM